MTERPLNEIIWKERYAHAGEESWSDSARRVANFVSQGETDKNIQEYWANEFTELIEAYKFIPGGRILSNAGRPRGQLLNCVSGDTLVHTDQGRIPAKDLEGQEVNVLSQGDKFRPAKWYCYGEQELWKVTMSNGDEMFATENHEWVVSKRSGGYEKVTTANLATRNIPTAGIYDLDMRWFKQENYDEGVKHGLTFGDGSLYMDGKYASLRQFTDSKEIIERLFEDYTEHQWIVSGENKGTFLQVAKLPASYKKLPTTKDKSYLRGFIAGLIAADGCVDTRGHIMFHNRDLSIVEKIRDIAADVGLPTTSIKQTRDKNPFNGEPSTMYKLTFVKKYMYHPMMILMEKHRDKLFASPKPKKQHTVKVASVEPTGRTEKVYCCVEPETHTMTIGMGYLTGQCFVIPLEDSRESIGQMLKEYLIISGTGGGVGISFSKLRPKGATIVTNGGVSSGSVSFMDCVDQVANTIKTGGGRRAATMISQSVYHPDVEEFLHHKLDLSKLTNANVSVEVDDNFLDAVRKGKDWDLVWNGKVMKTVKAKSIWDKLVENAWKAGEPGVLNMGLARKMSNSYYFNDLLTTNPCGEQFLPAYGSCCLGSMNVNAYVKEGRFQWKEFEQGVRQAIRFLDNVLTVNEYPLAEIRDQSQSERRVGLGLMGLHTGMLRLGHQYSSEEGIAFVEHLYEKLRDVSYEASAELAQERGSFASFDRDAYLNSGFAKTLPSFVRKKIRENGMRNVCVNTQAPTGTTAMIVDGGGVSSGIEPIFAPAYDRRFRSEESDAVDGFKVERVVDPLLKKFIDNGEPIGHFEGAYDVSVDTHLRIQEVAQRYVDSSISKTINLPEDYSPDELSKIWLEYADVLKGTTLYRSGSRGQEPLTPILGSMESILEDTDEFGVGENIDMSCPSGVCSI